MLKKCVIIFFGIDRRLDLTSCSISENIIKPAQKLFEIECVGHLWSPQVVNNPRSGERGSLEAPRLDLLPRGQYIVERPGPIENENLFNVWKQFGDCWDDNYKSLQNLYWQLQSLDNATRSAFAADPDIAMFVRPDLIYHDNFSSILEHIGQSDCQSKIYTPSWQPHGGLNDRFGIAVGRDAITAYGQRITRAAHFAEETSEPINAEKLLFHVTTGFRKRYMPHRASRVRLDGRIQFEDFSYLGWKLTLRRLLASIVPNMIKKLIRNLM